MDVNKSKLIYEKSIYEDIKTVACIGVGGGGVYYIAKFFKLLESSVIGFDINENDKIKDLKEMGVEIRLQNPTNSLNCDLVIYSSALPNNLIADIRDKNKNSNIREVGEFTNELIRNYEENKLNKKELDCFKKAEIAPLFNLDYTQQKFIGITGTDGKTTTSSMIYHVLNKLKYKVGTITTVSARLGDKEIDTGFHTTTPSSQELYKFIKLMQEKGCTHIILEITSQGLAMGRVAGIKLDTAVYTNITNEHLDYHKSWEEYAKAKSLLITTNLKKEGGVVLNKDDKKSYDYLKPLTKVLNKDSVDYSLSELSDIKETKDGIKFKLEGNKYNLSVIGMYNLSNMLATLKTCILMGIDEKKALQALSDFKQVEGRMEIIQKKPFLVIVDFAHTPNGLENALSSVKKITKNKVIAVFGCAGKRDATKRFVMGEIAKKYADITILTAEDPRTEDLKDINDEIERGWKSIEDKDKKLIRIEEGENIEIRRNAIEKALEIAEKGDTVIILGKGHEKSLCFGNVEYPWSDVLETKKLLKK